MNCWTNDADDFVRAVTITVAPLSVNSSAMAFPMPLVPPVTSATFPVSSLFVFIYYLYFMKHLFQIYLKKLVDFNYRISQNSTQIHLALSFFKWCEVYLVMHT